MGNTESEKTETIGEMLSAIEETVEKLSGEDLTLEEAFSLYEDGVRRVKACQMAMEDVEKKMQVLTEDGMLEDFGE